MGTLPSPAWGTPPQPRPPAQGSLLLCTVQWCLYSIGCARRARGLGASFSRHGWARGRAAAQPREPPRLGPLGGQARKGAKDTEAQRDSTAWAGECLPGWHAASSLTSPAPRVTDPRIQPFWLGQAPITSLGTLSTSPQHRSLCPCSTAARSRLQVPFETDGMQIIPPFQLLFKPCWPPLRAAAASHTHAGRAGTGLILGARTGECSIHHSHTKKLLIHQ